MLLLLLELLVVLIFKFIYYILKLYMYLNISNISDRSKIDFPEKLKYSNILKLNTH